MSSCTISGGMYNNAPTPTNGVMTTGPLNNNTTFTLNCVGQNGSNVSSSVTVSVSKVLQKPILISPGNNAIPGTAVAANNLTLNLNAGSGAAYYKYYMTDISVSQTYTYTSTSTSYKPPALVDGKMWKWSARAVNANGLDGYISDEYYFMTTWVEHAADERKIDLYLLDENDNPIPYASGELAYTPCDTRLPSCYLYADLKTQGTSDQFGKITLYFKDLFTNPNTASTTIYVTGRYIGAEPLKLDFTSSQSSNTLNAYVLNVDKSKGLSTLYQKYNVDLGDEFMEGVLLEGGLTLGSIALTKTAIVAGQKTGLTAVLKTLGVGLGEYAIKVGGKALTAETVAKIVPGVGLVVLVAMVGYAAYATKDIALNCAATDQYKTFEDPDFKFYKTAAFFCGRMAVRVSFVALGGIYAKPGVSAIEEALIVKAESKMAANLEESAAKPVLDIITRTGASLSEAEQVINEVTAIEDLAAPEAKALLNKAFANLTCLTGINGRMNVVEVASASTGIKLSACSTLADVEVKLAESVAAQADNLAFKEIGISVKGKAGELVAKVKDKYPFRSALSGKDRIIDGSDKDLKLLQEVKNRDYQAYTSQLKDYLAKANDIGYKLVLYTRETTKLSEPLKVAIAKGEIILIKMSNKDLLDAAKLLTQ